jgi:hypothetical protein
MGCHVQASQNFSPYLSAPCLQVGFSESNIRALCDVGRSTKTIGLGYIGQKGIGWKSVFRVRIGELTNKDPDDRNGWEMGVVTSSPLMPKIHVSTHSIA